MLHYTCIILISVRHENYFVEEEKSVNCDATISMLIQGKINGQLQEHGNDEDDENKGIRTYLHVLCVKFCIQIFLAERKQLRK